MDIDSELGLYTAAGSGSAYIVHWSVYRSHTFDKYNGLVLISNTLPLELRSSVFGMRFELLKTGGLAITLTSACLCSSYTQITQQYF